MIISECILLHSEKSKTKTHNETSMFNFLKTQGKDYMDVPSDH